MQTIYLGLLFTLLISSAFCTFKTSTSTSASGSGSASAGGVSASGSGSASAATSSLPIPIPGIANLPLTYVGVVTHTVSGLLGSLLPALSLVANTGVGNIVNLGASVITANGLSNTGATVSLNISLPACGLLQVVANTGLLTPVISLVSDLTNILNSLLGTITGVVNADLSLGNNLGIYCQAAPGCTVSLSAIALNGIAISEDLNVNGNSLHNVMSVLISNSLLSTCNFQITANLQVNCGVAAIVNDITQCNFLFGLLNEVTGSGGGLLGGLGLKK